MPAAEDRKRGSRKPRQIRALTNRIETLRSLLDRVSRGLSWNTSVIVSDREILGGPPCFRGTRVPVDSLIDFLEAGDSLDVFLDNFSSVTREAALALLEQGKERV